MARKVKQRFAVVPLAALEDSRVTSTDVAILTAICSFANRDRTCFPSQEAIAARAKCSRATVNKRIMQLVALGFLRVEARRENGHVTSHFYRLLDGRPVSTEVTQPVSTRLTVTTPGTNNSEKKEESKTPSSPPELLPEEREVLGAEAILPRALREAFRQFWQAYPKRIGKGAAVRAFARAFARVRASPALLQEILGAIERQKRSEQWRREGGQYIPNPATWLNQRRWEDEGVDAAAADAQPRKPDWWDDLEEDDDQKAKGASRGR